MKRILLPLLLLTLLAAGPAKAAGTVQFHEVYCPSLDENRWFTVYLPDGYDDQQPTRYPVIYRLHGWYGNQSSELPLLRAALDQMIAAGDLEPVIMVAPNGYDDRYGGSMWADSELYGQFETYVAQDVVDFTDATFMTEADPSRRALAGYSMGAIGAMRIAIKHADVFGAVAAQSGFQNWDRIRGDFRDAVLAENSGPPYEFVFGPSTYTSALFLVAGAYSTNLMNPPTFVDYPLDSNGDIVESVLDRWIANNPAVLAAAQLPGDLPAIYFDCGDQDEFMGYVTNFDLSAALDDLEVPHVFRPYVGTHVMTQEKFEYALTYIAGFLDDVTAVGDGDPSPPTRVALLPAEPNPVRSDTVIRFRTAEAGQATLRILDVRGRLVQVLVDGSVTAGDHAVTWQPRDLPAGTYLYELRADGSRESGKVLLTR